MGPLKKSVLGTTQASFLRSNPLGNGIFVAIGAAMASARRSGALALVAATIGCASHLPPVPPDVTVGSVRALPTPRFEPMNSAPVILGMHFSSLDVRRGERFSGAFVTGSNVASIEVRTNLFSIDVPRAGFGRFAFDLDVLDLPPIFIRPYRLRVIARNSAGDEFEQDLPFEIR